MRRLSALVDRTSKTKFIPSLATMNMMIKAYSSLKRIDEATALWREMTEVRAVEPNMISLGCITDALVVNDRLEEAKALVEEWRGRVPLNTIIYSTLIKGYAIRKDAKGALKVLDRMSAEGHAPNLVTINTVIDACCRAGALDECVKVFNSLPSLGTATSTAPRRSCAAWRLQDFVPTIPSSTSSSRRRRCARALTSRTPASSRC